ncbi:MauE/DoxX family redox-associated membrane protein [Streptomyces sp. NPDC052051]|uniref:MauE/DoxX family redox-associated membrane protein n=1 Tax=Streptomyces sp. NPDC052051 TaxID=3154649 RepID=UPI003426DD4C
MSKERKSKQVDELPKDYCVATDLECDHCCSSRLGTTLPLARSSQGGGLHVAYVLLAVRLLIGVVFAASVIGKVRGVAAFRRFEEAARAMGVPTRLSRPVAVAVVAGECAAVLLLALGPGGAPGFALTLLLLTAFTVGIVRTLRSGTKASCACFGASTAPIGHRHVVRNSVLLALAAFGLVAALSGTAMPSEAAGIAVTAFGALTGALLVIFTDELGTLFEDDAPRTPSRVRRTSP